MAQLPWQSGNWYPWQVGQTFVDDNGIQWQAYADPNSSTQYTVKRTDSNGTSYQPVNAPTDPEAVYQSIYGPNTARGKDLLASGAADAEQNQFNRDISQGGLDVNRGNLDVNRQNADTNRYNSRTSRQQADTGQYGAETTRQYDQALIEQAKQDLAFRYAQQAQTYGIQQAGVANDTLKLGASLSGPRNWDRYLATAASAGQNPLLQGALGTWSSLTNIRPNTGAVSGGLPPAFDLNALASDFMGGGGGQGGNGGGGSAPRDANLDSVAMGKAPAPGWWQGLSDSEKQRSQGYWETHGFDPSTVLNGLAYQSPNQNLGYGGA